MAMPAGTYYIGDLCYVMHDVWEEVCDLMFPPGERRGLEGEFTLKDGRKFSVHNTMYGDGEYQDQEGRKYWVDAGCIGCIAIQDIQDTNPSVNYFAGHGAQVESIPYNFETGNSLGGVICIGPVQIPTGDTEEDDDEGYC